MRLEEKTLLHDILVAAEHIASSLGYQAPAWELPHEAPASIYQAPNLLPARQQNIRFSTIQVNQHDPG